MLSDFKSSIQNDGYAVLENVVSTEKVSNLIAALADVPGEDSRRERNAYGIRNLLEVCPPACELARSTKLCELAEAVLGAKCFAVRALLFDKLPGANWKLGWHQDSVISVRERRDVPGFVGWANKAGVIQVQPPPEVLAGMLALRVHLDDCGEDNGPLRVICGSHNNGWLDDRLDEWTSKPSTKCLAKRGGVVAMRPLILHASSPAEKPSHRRVIHIEYANTDLPGGLEWNSRVQRD
jgi:ectoine hydroxylase-related dioxygenase (phytanoyl-CoA dioxygenase family)